MQWQHHLQLHGRTLTRLNWFPEDNNNNDLHEQRNDYPNIGDCAKHSNNYSSQHCGCNQVKSIKAKLRETAQEAALIAVAAVIIVVLRYTSYIDKRNQHR